MTRKPLKTLSPIFEAPPPPDTLPLYWCFSKHVLCRDNCDNTTKAYSTLSGMFCDYIAVNACFKFS